MSEIVGAFWSLKGREERANSVAYAWDGALRKLAQVSLEFAEGHLDRIKVRRVLRQIAKRCASRLDRLHDAGNFVGGQIIDHNDVVWLERRHEALFDIGQEQFSVHRPVDQHRRHHSIVTQRRYEGHGLPLSERHVINQSHPTQSATVEPHHVGVHAGLVDKYQPGGVEQALLADPLATRPRHVVALLFGSTQAFFLAGDFMTSQEAIQRAPAGVNALLAQRRQDFFQGGIRPLVDKRQYPLRVLLQPRRASAARLRRRTAGIAQPLQPFGPQARLPENRYF